MKKKKKKTQENSANKAGVTLTPAQYNDMVSKLFNVMVSLQELDFSLENDSSHALSAKHLQDAASFLAACQHLNSDQRTLREIYHRLRENALVTLRHELPGVGMVYGRGVFINAEAFSARRLSG